MVLQTVLVMHIFSSLMLRPRMPHKFMPRTSSKNHRFFVALSDLSDPATWQAKGRGNFGAVMVGQLRASGLPMCIKVFQDHAQGLSRLDNIRNQINELALVQELGQAQADTLASTCVFATHFSIDDRDATSAPCILVLLPLMHGTLDVSIISHFSNSCIL